MRRIIIKPQNPNPLEKKKVRTDFCIKCQQKYGVDPLSSIHWRGFCSKDCFKTYQAPNVKDYNKIVINPRGKGKGKKKRKGRCLFCKNKIHGGHKVFCNDSCKDSFTKGRKNLESALKIKGQLRVASFVDKEINQSFFVGHFWLDQRYKTILEKGNFCQKCLCPARDKSIEVYPEDLTLEGVSNNSRYKILCIDCSRDQVKDEIKIMVSQKNRSPIVSPAVILKKNDNFYDSINWNTLRYRIRERFNNKCLCCGVKGSESEIHVDHIKPRSQYPELELSVENLQTLCFRCNKGKSNKDLTDWRSI